MNKKLHFGWVDEDNMALLTDLYEFTMADSYLRGKRNEEATFDLFIRHLPENRSFLVSAGLEDIVHFLGIMRFTDDSIHYLRTLNLLSDDFLSYLKNFCFTGTVYAIPDGEIYFPNEPAIVVTAPRIEAQVVETFLLNTFNFQSLIATKAARVVIAAEGRQVVDFSPRRDHGTDAAMKVARSSYIAGCVGTSNVLAGKEFGIPVYGTMAHSYVMSYKSEIESFREFVRDFPENSVLLIDTYDVIEGARNAIIVGKEMGTSRDAPALGGVYKLVEDNLGPRMKFSKGKVTLPGKKSVFRILGEDGRFRKDVITEEGGKPNSKDYYPLLVKVMENGNIIYDPPSLPKVRDRFLENLKLLPDDLKNIDEVHKYKVEISHSLKSIIKGIRSKIMS